MINTRDAEYRFGLMLLEENDDDDWGFELKPETLHLVRECSCHTHKVQCTYQRNHLLSEEN